ncbi:MAG: hypothetical protein PVS2B2_22130 [Candidatus Acidiferrum sp.]
MIKKKVKSLYRKLRSDAPDTGMPGLMLLGKQMSWQVAQMPANRDFRQVGFKVFSQWDEDGIIQYLIHKLPITSKTFIEFGVENYEESNTRFLLMNDHWQGMVLDAHEADLRYIEKDNIHWQYDLQVKRGWITRENIDALLRKSSFGEDLGLLSIDIDGNDYWIWESLEAYRPRIVIVEYNSVFGLSTVAVPYDEKFARSSAHYSNLYYGASLGALQLLGRKKGYVLLGSNVWGHNAFFARADIAGEFRELRLEEAYVASKFRESRDTSGRLRYLRGDERAKLMEALPVVNVVTGEMGTLREFREPPAG